jgi:hypothetical protein
MLVLSNDRVTVISLFLLVVSGGEQFNSPVPQTLLKGLDGSSEEAAI